MVDLVAGPPLEETETPPEREGTPDAAPRRGRPPGSKNRTTGTGRGRARKVDLTDKIGGVLTLVNFALVLPQVPASMRAEVTIDQTGMHIVGGDALDDAEIALLAKALNAYAQENALAYKYLSALLDGKGSATLTLAFALATIGTRRLSRHGIIPAGIDGAIGAVAGVVGGVSLPPMPVIETEPNAFAATSVN